MSLEFRLAVAERLKYIDAELQSWSNANRYPRDLVEDMTLSVIKIRLMASMNEVDQYNHYVNAISTHPTTDQLEQLKKRLFTVELTDQRKKLIEHLLDEVELLLFMDQSSYKEFINAPHRS